VEDSEKFATGFTLRTLTQQVRAKTISLSEALQGTPCLVFRPLSEDISPLFHTGDALSASGVHVNSQTDSLKFQESRTHGYLDPTAIIAPLWKSERNAFAGMITVGRANACDIRVNSKEVSKTHAILKKDALDNWSLADNHSTNGTYLNSVKLIPGESYRLESNFEIQFSSIFAVFLTDVGLQSLCDLFEDEHSRAMTKRIKRPKTKCPSCGTNPNKKYTHSCADPEGCGLYKKEHKVVHRSFSYRNKAT